MRYFSIISLILLKVSESVLAAPQATATVAVTPKPCPDPLYPSCQPEQLTSPNFWGETFKVPPPPVIPAWVKWVKDRENPVYPIEVRPVSPNGTCLGWLDPENAATELCGCTDGKMAFTPYDGFLGVLERLNVKATFFVVGSNVVASSRYRQSLKAAYDAGHQIALHSWTHSRSTSQTTDELISEVILSARAVYDTIGKIPRYYRNPYGDIDDRTRNLMVTLGLRTALWNIDSWDTYDPTDFPFNNIIQRYIETATKGFQPSSPGSSIGLTWIPQAPAAVLAGATPDGPYVGFISLQHELLKAQLDLAEAIIPLIVNGTIPASFNPLISDQPTVPATRPTSTTATVTSTPTPTMRQFIPATVAECDGNDNRRYFEESEPFAQLVMGAKLPVHSIPTKTPNSATGFVSGKIWTCWGVVVGALLLSGAGLYA
ncbi:hypothetical protein BC829DRAFT_433655 [Chytridium lagenaria]|nr:hypothetical protein BC829DRAFT_433655 [Chytridium lagenaria]